MRHLVLRGFHFTASIPRLLHAGLVALLAIAALAVPLALA